VNSAITSFSISRFSSKVGFLRNAGVLELNLAFVARAITSPFSFAFTGFGIVSADEPPHSAPLFDLTITTLPSAAPPKINGYADFGL
jgi:hypothetical protein